MLCVFSITWPSCPHVHGLWRYMTGSISTAPLRLCGIFHRILAVRTPQPWPSLRWKLFIVAWLISSNTGSRLHLFYWWALLGRPQLACPLHNRSVMCVQARWNGGYRFSLCKRMSRTYHADKAPTVAPIVIAILGFEVLVEVKQQGVWNLLKKGSMWRISQDDRKINTISKQKLKNRPPFLPVLT